MNPPGPAVLWTTAAPTELPLGTVELTALAVVMLATTAFFAVLRSALLHSVPAKVLSFAKSDRRRARLRPLLERAESLATSASVFEITAQIFFILMVLGLVGEERTLWSGLGLSLLAAVPLLVFASELAPTALHGDREDRFLCRVLPAFDVLQKPMGAVIIGLEATLRAMMRVLRIPERPPAARRIVEVFRDVVEDSERGDELQEAEREILENVIEFYDVDVAEVMTPRTELAAVDVEQGLQAIVSAIAESGHSRIPVYEGSLDTIIGIAYAQEVLQLLHEERLASVDVRSLLRPVSFVPETKLLSELLTQFRRDKLKLVVVLDEYGGTAGLVTMGDVVTELVGDFTEELGESAPEPIRRREDGYVDVDAGVHVSEVNEELDVDLPEEEDYETLAGFVLARLGRFPKEGESFTWNGIDFRVTEANDRRVLSLRLRMPQPQS